MANKPPKMRPPNTYAQDPAIAAALLASSPQADQIQADQNSSSPALDRLTTPTPSSLGAAGQDVWVTVPVDKVSVAKGRGTMTPTYASNVGYQDKIPPVTTTGSRGQ